MNLQRKLLDERLTDSRELQKFLAQLDQMQLWLSRTRDRTCDESAPRTLADTEAAIGDLRALQPEIADQQRAFLDNLYPYGCKVCHNAAHLSVFVKNIT